MARLRLMARRDSQGWTQESLAQDMRVHSTTVARWERGETTPQAGQRRRLARRLNWSLDELNDALVADDVDAGAPSPLEQLRRDLDEVLSGNAMGSPTLEAWEATAMRHGLATRDYEPGDLLLELADDLAELKGLLAACRTSSALRRLTRVAAQMSGLVVLTLVKLDDHAGFQRWARTARIAGGEAGDLALLSWILAQEAYGHFYAGHHVKAVAVAAQAQDAAGRSPCVGVPLAAALEARAHAARGDAEQARAALQRAEDALEHLPAGDQVSSALGYNEAQFRFHAGSAHTLLGDTRAAGPAHERALELNAPGDFTDWAMIRLDQAGCHILDGDLAAALEHATSTLIDLTEAQRAGIITNRARELVEALPAGQRALPAVDELRDLVDADS